MKRQRAPLGELCRLIKGTSPISKTPPGPYPLVTTGEEHKTANTFQFDAEAVCIPLISSTGHGHASLKRVHYQVGKFALANLLAAAVVKDRYVLSAHFLERYLMFTKDRLVVPLMTGAANMSISIDRLATIPVEFPPFADQERIVKLLDEADELRKLRAQADRRTVELIPALFHEMFGAPVENPEGYPIQLLEQVCTRITDGTHQPPPFTDNGIPFLFVRNIVSGSIDFDTEKFITEETFAELTRRVKPERGDILYSTVGSYGVAVQVETDRKFAFQRHIGHLKPNCKQIDSGFLAAQLNTPSLKSQADQRARGIAQKTVNLAEIRKFKVLVPPLPLQKEFAKRVTEIRELETGQATSRERLDALFQSMLHRAFRGEL